MNALKASLMAQMQTAGNVTWARAPDGCTGTYAVAFLDLHPREDVVSQIADLRIDVYSTVSDHACVELADALDAALNGWRLPQGGLLQVGGIQHVPADQSDPVSTRITMDVTGVWVSPSRISALSSGGVS